MGTQPQDQRGWGTGVVAAEGPTGVAPPKLVVPPKANPTSGLCGGPPRRGRFAHNPETDSILCCGAEGMGGRSHHLHGRLSRGIQHGYTHQTPTTRLQQGELMWGVRIQKVAREVRHAARAELEGRNHEKLSYLGCHSTGRPKPTRENPGFIEHPYYMGLEPDFGHCTGTHTTPSGQTCGSRAKKCQPRRAVCEPEAPQIRFGFPCSRD